MAPTVDPSPVRIATVADEPEIIRLLHLMHAESGMMPLNEDCARATFARAFNRHGGIIGVIGRRNNIEAMIYLLITRFWFTMDDHIEELFNYVRPDQRKKNYAETLIGFAKKCSDDIGIPLVIGVLTNRRMEAKVRLYRRSLGMPSGAFFVYGAKWANTEASNENFWRLPFPDSGAKVVSPEVLAEIGGGSVKIGNDALNRFLNQEAARSKREGEQFIPYVYGDRAGQRRRKRNGHDKAAAG